MKNPTRLYTVSKLVNGVIVASRKYTAAMIMGLATDNAVSGRSVSHGTLAASGEKRNIPNVRSGVRLSVCRVFF